MGDTPPAKPLYYSDYLQLDRLLSSQELASSAGGEPVHDLSVLGLALSAHVVELCMHLARVPTSIV